MYAGASERMRIDSSGNVGIGTTSADGKMHVFSASAGTVTAANGGDELVLENSGTVGMTFLCPNNSAANILFGDPDDNNVGSIQYGHDTNYMAFTTNASERMRIDSSGDVLIGTTAMPGTGNTGGAGFDNVTNDRNILKLGHNADSSTKRAMAVFYYKNAAVGQIESSNSSTNYATSSDYRLKENVVDMTGAINRVKALAPKRFNFIVDTDDTTVDGFLAHEAQSVVPEAVTGTKDEVDEEGNPVMQGIDQSKLVPLLTGALQEAIARIETLEAEVSALKGA